MRTVCAAAVLLLCFASPVLSQTSNATLGGTVADRTGALIPGVTITATNTQTGIVNSVVTNETGTYQFASLQTGTYRVSSELPGFQPQVYNEVILGVGQQVRLNFTLQVGGLTETVEVSVAADTLLATSSSSIGSVLPEYKVRDLPLQGHNVLDLVRTVPGVQGNNFAGARAGQVNTTRDGVSIADGRYEVNGVYATTFTSSDLVEEVRAIVAPADAEGGRGVGQVQMVTRSGTNLFRGSVFWTNQNSALNANSFFSNFRGEEKKYSNQNQFGARFGGPIVRNKTFFFFLYYGERTVRREYITGNVLTAQARQGIFRYFPGVANGNVLASTPTVDRLGNSVKPAGATGDLQSFSVFGLDAFRPGFDPSGYMQKLIAVMPPPNNFEVGDGLNTAGYRWVRRASGDEVPQGSSNDVNRDQMNLRLDHNFNSRNKLSLIGSREHVWADVYQPTWPNGWGGFADRWPRNYTASLVSTLSPSVVTESRFGYRKGSVLRMASQHNPKTGADAYKWLPEANGFRFYVIPQTLGQTYFANTQTTAHRSPLTTFAETVSRTQGQHTFKGGVELRFAYSNAIQSAGLQWLPLANLGAGGIAVTGVNPPGINGADVTRARNLLTDLAGSVASVVHTSDLRNPIDTDYIDIGKWNPHESHQNDFNLFFKDDWKLRRNLTLNLGVRYDRIGVPYEATGQVGAPVGGSKGLFGISGTSEADMYQPGRLNGSLTQTEPVGKYSLNPDKQLYKDDRNNFGPAIGLSWSVPWGGADKTVIRTGYGISYQAGGEFQLIDRASNSLPTTRYTATFTSSNYLDLKGIKLPLSRGDEKTFLTVPVTDRTLNILGFDSNRVTPYVQNWNVELQRELARNLTVEARYVASKGTKLFGVVPINDANIFENGILEAFNMTRAGGNAPLFDRMLRGLNVTGVGVVNGTTITGSQALRLNTNTRSFLANGNVGQLADFLNRSTNFTGQGGGILRNGGLPENFVVTNPQFNTVGIVSNPGTSTYHSMQLQITKRLSQGFTNQTSYTWSRGLGEGDNDETATYRNPRNRSFDKTLLSFHRTHAIQSNGTWELPLGPGHALLGNTASWFARVIERWQLGGIFNWTSGAPLTIGTSTSSWIQLTNQTPMIVGDFPKSSGRVVKTSVPGVITYLDGFQQITDPSIAGVTTTDSLRNQFSNYAIADSQGRVVLMNPGPGQLGNLGQRWIEGPASLRLDMNLLKRVRISETKEFELRVDAINLLNKAQWGNPTVDIDNTNFGKITAATGSRTFSISSRINF
jgi:hypothetical protein